MKRIISLILIVTALSMLVSCSNDDEVEDEIIHYYNEEWVPINDMKEKEMRGIPMELTRLEEENKEDEAINLVENEMIPIVDEVLERLNSVDPKNEEIDKMNSMQIEAEEFAKDTLFKNIIIYYEDGDVSENDIRQYDEELREKYQKVLDYRDELMDKYNLEQTESEDEDSKYYKLKRAEE